MSLLPLDDAPGSLPPPIRTPVPAAALTPAASATLRTGTRSPAVPAAMPPTPLLSGARPLLRRALVLLPSS